MFRHSFKIEKDLFQDCKDSTIFKGQGLDIIYVTNIT
jgi:hypothetical protein